jgi:hypothetical protein
MDHVQVGKGFIQQQKTRRMDKDTGQGDPLTFAAGELVRTTLEQVVDMTKLIEIQSFLRTKVIGIREYLPDVVVIPELEVLGEVGDARLARNQSFQRSQDFNPFEKNCTRCRRCETCNDFEQIAFTGTGLSNDRQPPAFALRKRDILYRHLQEFHGAKSNQSFFNYFRLL